MMCLRICGNGPGETFKVGAIVPYEYQHLRPKQQQQEEEETPPTNRIPWVFARSFHDNYRLGRELGRGAFSIVREATCLQTSETYAIKVVHRRTLLPKQLLDFTHEISILAQLQHSHIIRLHQIYKEPKHFYVVLEELHGGELYDQLCRRQNYCEMDARDVCRTLLDAVSYCHAQKVVHRDLKPENLLLKDSVGLDLKLADFGFAKRVPQPRSLTTRCGTPAYTAPEIIQYQPYDERVDNWSLGVIVYTLLGGYPPFYESTTRATFQQIVTGAYQFHPAFWDGISRDAKNMISRLLTINPEQRLTSAEALEHAWMTGRSRDGDLQQQQQKQPLTNNLQQFKEFNAERNHKNAQAAKSVSMYWLLTRR